MYLREFIEIAILHFLAVASPGPDFAVTARYSLAYGRRIGRYVALGPGELSERTLAHEFGHLLGFGDGYIRGYRDLGEEGFEILELTTGFDDIMSAPREGGVQVRHFELLVEGLGRR